MQFDVVDFAMRENGGSIRVEREGTRDTLRLLNSDGSVILAKTTFQSGAKLSLGGRYALFQTPKEKGLEFEVIDANGKMAWSKSLAGREFVLNVSDAGLVLRTPGVEGGTFSVFDARGSEIPIDDSNGPQPYESAWSPSGKSALVALDHGAKIFCIGPDAKPIYSLHLPYKVAAWGRVALWDDNAALLTVVPGSSKEPSELIWLDTRGVIWHRREVAREYSIGAPVAISPDETAVAYVESGELLKVVRKADFKELAAIQLPKKQRVLRIVFGRNNDDLLLVGKEAEPIYRVGDPRIKTAGQSKVYSIYLVRGGVLSPKVTECTLSKAASIRFRPRFDSESGAFIFYEGDELRRSNSFN